MSVLRRVIGEGFARLPCALRSVHDERSDLTLVGRCDIQRGKNPWTNWMARMAVLPPGGENVPITVRIARRAGGETWSRDFHGHTMRSRLRAQGDMLIERLGAITLSLRLQVVEETIEWRVVGVKFLGMPLPAAWSHGAWAVEAMIDGRYTFDVRVELPWVGLLIHYRGWLSE